MIGDIIGNYRIVRELGQGGMGAVYEGIDIMVERPVAIKMLKAELAGNPDVIERFRVEAVTLARLNHPCIATLYSFFREGENYYMVMEFVRGETLEDLIRRSGRLAAEYAADILAQTLDGMAHAHAMGVLHRDIKPANIMITGEGRVKVTDFGIARVLGSSRMTRDGRIIGTLEYLAPERIRGEEADVRSDLYSVGVVMYEAISGRLPFTADTDYDLMQAHLNQAPPSLRSLGVPCPAWAADILDRAMAKSRDKRFQSAEEFRNALSEYAPRRITQTGTTPAVDTIDSKTVRGASDKASAASAQASAPVGSLKRLPLKWIVCAAAALIVLIGLLVALRTYREGPTENPPMAASAPQSIQSVPQPLPPVEPAKQPAQSETGRIIPLEIFQSKPSAVPRESSPTRSGETASKTEGIKEVEIPRQNVAEEAVAAAEPPAPANATAREPAAPADSAPAPAPAPVPKADPPPPAASSASTKTLQDVRRIFVDKMPDQLDAYVKSEIDKQLFGRVRLVSRREDADAIFQGDRSETTGSAILTDASGTTVFWKDEVGDESSLLGITRRGGPKKLAERLVGSLKKKMNY
ncbi:MAG: serine/threonine-protein kinase [Acidobacteriota bacterium]|nr:serine/threonine-protein kinase [Acidobacteriota bacterium]